MPERGIRMVYREKGQNFTGFATLHAVAGCRTPPRRQTPRAGGTFLHGGSPGELAPPARGGAGRMVKNGPDGPDLTVRFEGRSGGDSAAADVSSAKGAASSAAFAAFSAAALSAATASAARRRARAERAAASGQAHSARMASWTARQRASHVAPAGRGSARPAAARPRRSAAKSASEGTATALAGNATATSRRKTSGAGPPTAAENSASRAANSRSVSSPPFAAKARREATQARTSSLLRSRRTRPLRPSAQSEAFPTEPAALRASKTSAWRRPFESFSGSRPAARAAAQRPAKASSSLRSFASDRKSVRQSGRGASWLGSLALVRFA